MVADQGMNFFSFEKLLPDDHACFEHLFWARGGQRIICPNCNVAGKWVYMRYQKQFRCQCYKNLRVRNGTPFFRSQIGLWRSYCGLIFFLNFGRLVPGRLMARHLGIGSGSAWHFQRRLRNQIEMMKGRVLRDLCNSNDIFIEEQLYRHINAPQHRGSGRMSVLHLSDGTRHLSFAMPSRAQRAVRRFLIDQIGSRKLWCRPTEFFDRPFYLYKGLVRRCDGSEPESIRVASRMAQSHGIYCRRALRKGPKRVSREHLPQYLAELDFRFAYARDKRAMFPDFFRSFGPVQWSP